MKHRLFRDSTFLPGFVFLILAGVSTPAWTARSPSVRIGVQNNVSSVHLKSGHYRLEGKVPQRTLRIKKSVRVVPTNKGFSVGKQRWGNKVTLTPVDRSGVVSVDKRSYRGAIELTRSGNGIRVVNILTVEDYLRGVLQLETSDKWPSQALQAQAVISRTYALRNRGRHGRSGYDLCMKPHCQAYGGATAERTKTDAAVKRTQGEVVVDRKKRLVTTVYHSSCGGSTESAENVWEKGGQPYLKATRCRWCRKSPHASWVARVPIGLVNERIKRAGIDIGTVRAIGILNHTPSGRVYYVRIYGENGTKDLKANKFRNLVDPALIRSTFWTGISKLDGFWQIHGRGWGHGVGLCQWGMKYLADNKYSYGQIVQTYYKGVHVMDWKE